MKKIGSFTKRLAYYTYNKDTKSHRYYDKVKEVYKIQLLISMKFVTNFYSYY